MCYIEERLNLWKERKVCAFANGLCVNHLNTRLGNWIWVSCESIEMQPKLSFFSEILKPVLSIPAVKHSVSYSAQGQLIYSNNSSQPTTIRFLIANFESDRDWKCELCAWNIVYRETRKKATKSFKKKIALSRLLWEARLVLANVIFAIRINPDKYLLNIMLGGRYGMEGCWNVTISRYKVTQFASHT